MSADPTPGPWGYKAALVPQDGAWDYCVSATIDGKPYVIGEAYGRVAGEVFTPARQNAIVMAAAPELRTALRDLLNAVVDPDSHGGGNGLIAAIGAARRLTDRLDHELGEEQCSTPLF